VNKKKFSKFGVSFVSVISLICGTSHFAIAESMSSANYQVQNDAFLIGGGHSTSVSFSADDAIGEWATSEDLTSTNFRACSGFECFQLSPYVSFTVKEGTSAPGTAGAGVNLGTITSAAVTTSDGASVKSIFITSASNSSAGTIIRVTSQNAGLKRTSAPTNIITSATATLVAGTEGYGLCVFSTTQDSGSPTVLNKTSPYNSGCTKTSSHSVGVIDTTSRTILSASGAIKGGAAEVLVKAASSTSTINGTDYTDVISFVASATF
jgi:hypothetical protein